MTQETPTSIKLLKKLKFKHIDVSMSDNTLWEIPVSVIAVNRASYYAKSDNIDYIESLSNDTIPLFNSDPYEIEDWAKNNMNWEDVSKYAVKKENVVVADYEDEWSNAPMEIN